MSDRLDGAVETPAPSLLQARLNVALSQVRAQAAELVYLREQLRIAQLERNVAYEVLAELRAERLAQSVT